MLDGIHSGDQDAINRAISLAVKAEMTPDMVKQALKAGARNRNTDAIIRRFTNAKGRVSSNDQIRKFREHQAYE